MKIVYRPLSCNSWWKWPKEISYFHQFKWDSWLLQSEYMREQTLDRRRRTKITYTAWTNEYVYIAISLPKSLRCRKKIKERERDHGDKTDFRLHGMRLLSTLAYTHIYNKPQRSPVFGPTNASFFFPFFL